MFLTLILCSAGLLFRIASLHQSEYAEAAQTQGTRVLEAAQTRGMIYDRNGLALVNTQTHTRLVINPTEDAIACLQASLSVEDYESLAENLADGKPFVAVCDSYTGSCPDIIEVVAYDRYSSGDVAAHIIGYLDSSGAGVSGIEKAFDSFLSENTGTFSVRYYASATGYALTGKGFEVINNQYDSAAGLVLTLDREIQRICEEAAERNHVEKGAVVVLDAQTSEILAAVSLPSFDRSDLAQSLASEDSPFLNRVLNAYSVGSIFKPVVAAAALEKGISPDTVFDCQGAIAVSGQTFHCHQQTGHGALDMASAMAQSCNVYFISLGAAAGAQSIVSTASALGFGREISLCDGIASAAGILPDAQQIDSAPALANLSFGQGTLLATPLQIAAAYAAFANGGYYREPYILKEMIDADGEVTAYYKSEINQKVLPDSICATVRSMLEETVTSGSGKLAKPMCYDAAGKTATAETGWVIDGRDVVHTWFAGYYPAQDPKYVIVVFKEDGSASSTDCAPVFRDIADGITALEEDVS